MKTITGNMLNGIERDLLRIAQELAVIHGQITAAKFVAVGVMSSTEDQPWFSRDEHYEPLVKASEQMIAARNATLQAVREVQGTNPIPARACTSLQHEGYPTRDDLICTECSGTGYIAGIEEEQDWGSPVAIRVHDHSYKDEPNQDDARLELLNHWEGDHAKDADSYEEAGGNATRLTWQELIELHNENHVEDWGSPVGFRTVT